jgi:hypothetical protein
VAKRNSKSAYEGMVCNALTRKNSKDEVPSFCRIIFHKFCRQVGVIELVSTRSIANFQIYNPSFKEGWIFVFATFANYYFLACHKILTLIKN